MLLKLPWERRDVPRSHRNNTFRTAWQSYSCRPSTPCCRPLIG